MNQVHMRKIHAWLMVLITILRTSYNKKLKNKLINEHIAHQNELKSKRIRLACNEYIKLRKKTENLPWRTIEAPG